MDADSRTAVYIEEEKLLEGIPSSAGRIQRASGWSSHTKYWREKVGRRVAETAGEVCQGLLQFTKPCPQLCALCLRFRINVLTAA
jgi:hypothetical protein